MKISFVGNKGRKFTEQMALLKKDYLKNHSELEFDYYTANIHSLTGKALDNAKKNLKSFLSTAENVIISDGSLNVKGLKLPMQNAVMLVEPYDYLFKQIYNWKIEKLSVKEGNLATSCKKFITPNSVFTDLFNKGYVKASVVEEKGFLLADSLLDSKMQEQKKSEFIKKFDLAADVEVIAFLTKDAGKDSCVEVDGIIKNLGENQILVTNNKFIVPSTKVIRIENSKQLFDLLYFTDILYTDYSYFACYYATRKKPLYILANPGLWFTKYIEEKYPNILVESKEDLILSLKEKKECKSFIKNLAIKPSATLGDDILELLEK